MARISLKCDCGWSFFIAESTQGSQVTCPNCSEPVNIPGRAGGGARLTPGEIAAKKIQQARTTKLLVISVGGVVLMGAIIVMWMMSGGEDPDAAGAGGRYGGRSSGQYPTTPGRDGAKPKQSQLPGSYRPVTPITGSKPNRPKVEDPGLKIDVPFFQTQIIERTWHVNMRGIVAEVLRLRGLEAQRAEILRMQQEDEARIQGMLKKLADAGASFEAPGRMRKDDKIVSLSMTPIAGVPVSQGRMALETWLRKFHAPVLTEEVHVQRGDKRVALFIGFPKETKELLQLVRYPDTLTGGVEPSSNNIPGVAPVAGTGARPSASAVLALPADVMEDIKARFELLPRGYFMLLALADRTRLGKLQKQMKGTPYDLQFLNNLKGKVLPRFESEAVNVRNKVRNLEAKVTKGSTSVDVIHFKSPPGRKVQGKVVEQTATHVSVALRFGKVKYPKADILRIEKGGGAGGEFPDRYKKAKGNSKAMQVLLGWCKDNNLKMELEFVGYKILMEDPTNEPARKAVRLPRPVSFIGSTTAPSPRSTRPVPGASSGSSFVPASTVEKRIEVVAAEVAAAHPKFVDVITQVRVRTDGLRTSTYPAPPPVALRVTGTIQNPLTFEPARLPVTKALELSNWWSGLSATERQSFSRYFALWCAWQRTR